MTWINAADVKRHSQVKYDMLGFADEAAYDTWITETLLPRCESVIEDYCGQNFPDATVSDTVKYVCATLAAKIIQQIIMNATAPIVRISDYQVEVARLVVFSKDLKDLLDAHLDPRHYVKSTEYKTEEIKETWDE